MAATVAAARHSNISSTPVPRSCQDPLLCVLSFSSSSFPLARATLHVCAQSLALPFAYVCINVCTQFPGATERPKLWCLPTLSRTSEKKLSPIWVCFVSPQYVVLRAPNTNIYMSESPSD